MTSKHLKIEKRKAKFALRTPTKIWDEQPVDRNPYLVEQCRCHGYNLLDLIKKRSFVEVLYLLFQGELPSSEQKTLLETLMIAFINPGPRHPATRAAMNAGIGRSNLAHILPVSLSILSGDHLGGNEVSAAMRFFRKHENNDPEEVAEHLLQSEKAPQYGDWHIAPGFGCHFGEIDPICKKIANLCSRLPASGKTLQWGNAFTDFLAGNQIGWLSTGIAAAVFTDLGFHPRVGPGLFQIISAPGLLAHGIEMASQPITSMPFLDQEHYVIKPTTTKSK